MHHVMWVGRLSRCLVAQRFRLPHRDLLASLCSFSLYHLTLLNISVLYPLTQGPMFFPFTRMLSQNAASRGWTDDSMIKSIFRGPRFSSQNPHGGLQPFVSLVPGTLTPSGLCRHRVETKHSYIEKKKNPERKQTSEIRFPKCPKVSEVVTVLGSELALAAVFIVYWGKLVTELTHKGKRTKQPNGEHGVWGI